MKFNEISGGVGVGGYKISGILATLNLNKIVLHYKYTYLYNKQNEK